MKKIALSLTVVTCLSCLRLVAQDNTVFNRSVIIANMQKVAQWQLEHSNKKALTDWTNGAFYAGLMAAYQSTQTPFMLDSMLAMGERMHWLPGRRYDHADDYAICQTYLDLYRIKKDPAMIQAVVDSVQKMEKVPGNEIRRHGITWWWCDALFMAPPTLAKLAVTQNDPSYLVYCDTLFHQTYRLLYNQDEHLFARDASYLIDANGKGKKEANGQKIFWGRGNGWVMGGLVRLLEEMPASYKGRKFYVKLFREMARRLVSLQQADGLWRSSLLDPEAYPGGEGSGSGFNCYALAWGIHHGLLKSKQYLPAVKKAWEGISGLLHPDGLYGWVQPIGADPRKNFNADSWEAYGAGAYLLAASEMIQLPVTK
jgi:rhamnogalacturonyl hydrolase YesR